VWGAWSVAITSMMSMFFHRASLSCSVPMCGLTALNPCPKELKSYCKVRFLLKERGMKYLFGEKQVMRCSLACDSKSLCLCIADKLNVLLERHVTNVNVLIVKHSKHQHGTQALASGMDTDGVVARPVGDV
jgi:hypothetical protein